MPEPKSSHRRTRLKSERVQESSPPAAGDRPRLKSERVQEDSPAAAAGDEEEARGHRMIVRFPDGMAALRFVTAVAALGQIYGLELALACGGGRVEVKVAGPPAGPALDSAAARGLEELLAALVIAARTEGGRP